MISFNRLKNKAIAKLITRYPALSKKFIESYRPWESEGIPWTNVIKPIESCKVALVTTSGLHHKKQPTFNMTDVIGDPSFREIDGVEPVHELTITHDYYDHADADKDINIVFPIERLQEFAQEGLIGALSDKHYAFMGHIVGAHIATLINQTAPQVANSLRNNQVDVVILTPG
jgi:D-proline reductase (dithiol) PrdB